MVAFIDWRCHCPSGASGFRDTAQPVPEPVVAVGDVDARRYPSRTNLGQRLGPHAKQLLDAERPVREEERFAYAGPRGTNLLLWDLTYQIRSVGSARPIHQR
jgi:hypothetical protein